MEKNVFEVKKMESKEIALTASVEHGDKAAIKNLIYHVRNQQVMMDSDLAALYHVDTGRLNEAVKRNILRFPENFRFQLTKEEYENLMSQSAISNIERENNGRGGRRKLPHVFTEQGIAMLSSVLRSEIAITVSIRIMESFVEMRKYMASTSLLHERLNTMEVRQLNYQKKTDKRLDMVFDYFASHEESEQKVFFKDQIYDAFRAIAKLIQKADTNLILVDNYVDINTLNLLTKKKENVAVTIYTQNNSRLTNADVETFNAQYPLLNVKYTREFHDRFLIVDDKYGYNIGASIKDAGKKCFAINPIHDVTIIQGIINRLI
jgi:hypothetical protein